MAHDDFKKLSETVLPTFGKTVQVSSSPMTIAIPKLELPKIPPVPSIEIPTNQNLASEFHRRLIDWIGDFDKSLEEEFEVGVRLVNFGQSITFHLQDIGFWNPSLISFSGHTDQGEPVELIQHVSQISILLLKLKRQDTSQPKRPIGFGNWDKEEQN